MNHEHPQSVMFTLKKSEDAKGKHFEFAEDGNFLACFAIEAVLTNNSVSSRLFALLECLTSNPDLLAREGWALKIALAQNFAFQQLGVTVGPIPRTDRMKSEDEWWPYMELEVRLRLT